MTSSSSSCLSSRGTNRKNPANQLTWPWPLGGSWDDGTWKGNIWLYYQSCQALISNSQTSKSGFACGFSMSMLVEGKHQILFEKPRKKRKELDRFPFQVPSSHDPPQVGWLAGFFRLVPLVRAHPARSCWCSHSRRLETFITLAASPTSLYIGAKVPSERLG